MLLIKNNRKMELVWDSFLMPFHEKTWVVLLLILVGSGLAMVFMDKIWKRTSEHSHSKPGSPSAVLVILGIFCSQSKMTFYLNASFKGGSRLNYKKKKIFSLSHKIIYIENLIIRGMPSVG